VSDFDVVTSPLRVDGADAVPRPLLIEASAGSGKTWTLAHLAIRLMVEDDVEPSEILMVTFTRAAARELRGRVRAQLAGVVAACSGAAGDEPWERALAARWSSDDDRDRDLRRARHCLARVDEVQASTIHAFAAGAVASVARRLADGERERRQAIAQTRARWALERPGEYALVAGDPARRLEGVVRALYDAGVRGPDHLAGVRVLPEGAAPPEDPGRAAWVQRDLALEVVESWCELMARARTVTFADLVVELADRLEGPEGPRLRAELRATHRVVMVDEFQDTDPLQWRVIEDLFAESSGGRLILVGDPKQAIYRFRAASVDVFLGVRDRCRAAGVATATLSSNRRSTPEAVAAMNALFAGADFHYPWSERVSEATIGYEEVVAHETRATGELLDETGSALHLRVGPYVKDDYRAVYDELVAYVRRLRAQGIAFRDMAVLCLNNYQCREVHRHLGEAGLPSTTASEESIFLCEAARQLRHLVAAVASPEEVGLTEVLRATWFAGPHGADPADTWQGQEVAALAAAFAREGVVAIGRFLRRREVLEAVARRPDGERHLTDLAHLGELMVDECRAVASASGVIAWLDDAKATQRLDEDATARRLETESDAVRVLTVHKAKGLEFDVVLAPRLVRELETAGSNGRDLLRWVDDGRVVIDAGSGVAWGSAGEVEERRGRSEAESAAETRRLIYVALTRARRASVAWVRIPGRQKLGSEMVRLLLDRDGAPDGSRVRNRSLAEVRRLFVTGRQSGGTPSDLDGADEHPLESAITHLGTAPGLSLRPIGEPIEVPPVAEVSAAAPGPRAAVSRSVATRARERRRWSYTDVARDLADLAPEGDEEVAGTDEASPEGDEAILVASLVRPDVAGVFGSLAGARLGVVVHRVLERTVEGEALEESLGRALREEGVTVSDEDRVTMATSLTRVRERPLASTLQGRSLSELDPRDAATEMRFLLSLGESPRLDRLADAARAAVGADASELFRGYLDRGLGFTGRLAEGFLVGSLDLTVRGSDGRYRVVDYKTDQLPGATRPYGRGAMAAHMEAHHYPLQALFYAVALHRHLRVALAGYDPERHLGGIDYYFVRVVGDGSAHPDDGLLHWDLTPAAVVAASDAMGAP
jgi:exodeoxyribonuclease V beta subunit